MSRGLGDVYKRQVTAAVKAGEAVAKEIGEVYAVNVIPRPHDDIAKILPSI